MRNKFKRHFIVLTVALLTLGSSNVAWAKSHDQKTTGDKIKSGIDTSAEYLKKGVEKTGDAFEAIEAKFQEGKKKFGEKVEDLQAYFHKKYHEQAKFGLVSVSDVKFNDHRFAAVVKPGEPIEVKFKCTLSDEQLRDIKYHSLLIGYKGRENAEVVVDLGRGFFISKESQECVNLVAPSDPGFYKIRFRPIEGYFEHNALQQWQDVNGEEPGHKATLGIIYVKKPK